MKTYGLIGYPVKHSLSAAMHNAAFRHLGIDAEYKLFEVKPEELKDFFASFKDNLSGINITIPHKEAALKYMDSVDDQACSIGAINTVVLDKGSLVGYNTDAAGFGRALENDLGFKAGSKKAVMLGAGGAGRAISFELGSLGISRLVIADLDTEKAASLVGGAKGLKEAGYNAIATEYDKKVLGEIIYDSDLLLNATPCGMKEGDPELIEAKFMHEGLSVFDLIYNPSETVLVKKAKQNGCKAINGLKMLLYQGAEAFTLWTKHEAPIDVMWKALTKGVAL